MQRRDLLTADPDGARVSELASTAERSRLVVPDDIGDLPAQHEDLRQFSCLLERAASRSAFAQSPSASAAQLGTSGSRKVCCRSSFQVSVTCQK
jgi:DNA-binding FadR family transcriptional regulator